MLLSFISTDCRNNEIQIQMTEIIFLCWVSGLFLNEMEVIQKWIGVEPLNLHNQLSQQRCCWDADVSGVCPSGRGLQGSPSTHWRNYVSWLGEYLKVLQVGSWGAIYLGHLGSDCCHSDPGPDKWHKMGTDFVKSLFQSFTKSDKLP